jgi:hypothetical protein
MPQELMPTRAVIEPGRRCVSLLKDPTDSRREETTMPEHDRSPFASSSVARHLLRGVMGFGLIAGAFALAAGGRPVALALLVPGVVALRGCPTCWAVGLLETVSAGRLRRSCAEGSCTAVREHAGHAR